MRTKKLIFRKWKPRFFRVLGPSSKRVKESWRYPKGIDSKKRRKVKAKGALPGTGYRTPREIRGLHPSGYPEVIVHNPEELEGLEGVVVRIAGRVGRKKREEIIKRAKELGIRVVNAHG